MVNPTLVVDTWESGGEIDEALLLSEGVRGIFVRLNSITGGHHMDANFAVQWEQAVNMVRVPYFVYNPWASGQANYDWLASHMPSCIKAVAIDVEVVFEGYSPTTYAAEFGKFMALVKAHWNVMVYTGQWFLTMMAFWPKDDIYWWAQYPFALYPVDTEAWTWEKLRSVLSGFERPLNGSFCPGPVKMWQFTGDRLLLPGCTRELDVSVYFGSYDELAAWAGGTVPEPPPVIPPTGIETSPGVVLYKIERFGCPVFVHVIDPQIADVWVTGLADKFRQAQQTAAKYQSAGVVTNGGGWPYGSSLTNEAWKSRGTLLKGTSLDGRPWLGVTKERTLVFGYAAPSDGITNAVGYDRFLGQGGVFNERYRFDKVKDARTFSGVRKDGKLVLCVAEGNDVRNYGLTFLEEWEVLVEFGVVTGGNHDGGSSSQ
ncbi:MAG TPA: phosphodiester glycosidase family protein, partial [Candidatus Paceibacterota bacterium]